ncbi:MAG TPA: TonB family protein [Chitinophaga sp.]|uniref:TonB family protein n=1 Tax=Chitinophaga sp. TaxID=1869181 RepID=UPI002F92BB00
MRSLLLLAFAGMLPLRAFSQDTTILFMNKYWNEVPAGQATHMRRVISKGEDATGQLYEIQEYTISGRLLGRMLSNSKTKLLLNGYRTWYNNNQQPSKTGYYTKSKPSGQWTDYYYNGQMKMQYSFAADAAAEPWQPEGYACSINNSWDSTGCAEVINGNGWFLRRSDSAGVVLERGLVRNGLPQGIWQGFDSKGQLQYEEEYANGKFLKGICCGENGQETVYDSIQASASFPGGYSAMTKFISQHIKYPAADRRMGNAGTVIVRFEIDKKGNLTESTIHRGVSQRIDEEALRVISLMPLWEPGKLRGKNVRMAFFLPLKFALEAK